MAGQAGRFGQAELARSAEILSEGLIQMRGTTSPRLLLELMCAQVLLPGASTSEKALLTRLERMERRLEGMPAEGPVPTAGQQTAPPRPAAAQEQPPAAQRATSGGRKAAEDRPAPSGDRPASQAERPASRGRPASQEHPAAGDASAAEPAAGSVMPAHTAAPVRGGAIDADVLRQRWPEVLDAVKGQRRIAWMLLGPASVESLEGGVLTVAFPKEGEAKGFASSGCDQVLATALGTLLGLNVRVRAVVGTGVPGPGPRTPPRSAPQAPEPQAPSAPGPDAPPGGPEPAADDPGGSAGPGRPANQAAAPHPAPAERKQGSKASSRRGAAKPAPAAPEEWPDDAGPAGDAPAVTGMELIERQLGGRVIEEIEEP